jgi:hypothetical protein
MRIASSRAAPKKHACESGTTLRSSSEHNRSFPAPGAFRIRSVRRPRTTLSSRATPTSRGLARVVGNPGCWQPGTEAHIRRDRLVPQERWQAAPIRRSGPLRQVIGLPSLIKFGQTTAAGSTCRPVPLDAGRTLTPSVSAHIRCLRLGQQLTRGRRVDQRRLTRRRSIRFARHDLSVCHLVVPSESLGLRVGPRSLTQRN